jgi:dephospho-CoA kinase
MKFAGLSGGIGSGKSTVGRELAQRGAVVIDVDLLSRELQQPGKAVFTAMTERWGDRIIGPDGTLDRQAVADIVFMDADEMAALMALTSPALEAALYERVENHEETDAIVILEAALLAGAPRLYGIGGLIVVDLPDDEAARRLVQSRGMREDDARARMTHQPDRESRLLNADFVIDNSATIDALSPQLELAWRWLETLPDGRLVARS